MVPLACLLVLLPLAFAGSQEEMMQMMAQQMMQQQMMQKGWGYQQPMMNMQQQHPQPQQPAQSKEDYEAYLKWCEERRLAMAEQEQQKKLLEEFQKVQDNNKREREEARAAGEQKERREAMMAHFRQLQMKTQELASFDNVMDKFVEMKHQYMFAVVMEFLKFCKCSDFTSELERYFQHGDYGYQAGQYFDIDDLKGFIDTNNADAIARRIANLPVVDQVKAFFGGLAYQMCQGGKAYVMTIKGYEQKYNFLERLM